MILHQFIDLILIGLTLICGSYYCARVAWIDYTKNCLEFFSQEIDFTNIPLLIKEHKYKYLSPFIFFAIFSGIGYYFMFNATWFLWKEIFIYDIVIMIISYICFIFFIFLYWKKIKALTSQTKSKKEATMNFHKYQTEMKTKQIITFKVFKSGQLDINNVRFQLNQRLYKWRIKRLTKKKISQDKYDFKLLKIYIVYLKVYAVFFKRLKYSIFTRKIRADFYNYHIILENNINESWENLPKILINNFFAFVNETKNTKKDDNTKNSEL